MNNSSNSHHDHRIVSLQPNNTRVDTSSLFLSNNERAFSEVSCCGNGISILENHENASQDLKQTEDFLAAEISKLSFQERNQAYEDIHCVGQQLQEDPVVTEQLLQAFQQQVDALRPKTPLYQVAEAMNANYVNDRAFRIKFLRANIYDVKKAVNQMMKFLQYKEQYFGRGKLCKEIDLSDLTKEDRSFMKTGPFIVSKNRDRAGRAVIQILNTKLSRGTASSVIRVSFYVWWNLLIPLEEVQLKGLVGVYYDIQKPDEKPQPMKIKDAVEIMGFALALPFRYSSAIWCLKEGKKSSLINSSILGVSTKAFSTYIRARTRLNYGSDLELQYQLQSLGIPLQDFPVDKDGNLRQSVIDNWYHEELRKTNGKCKSESANHRPVAISNPNPLMMMQLARVPVAVHPRPQDILFGRGVGCQNHPGNVRFREIMLSYKEQYDNVPRSKRREMMSALRHALQAGGSRFLRLSEGGNWEECNAAEADTKVGQFFRSLRKNKKGESISGT